MKRRLLITAIPKRPIEPRLMRYASEGMLDLNHVTSSSGRVQDNAHELSGRHSGKLSYAPPSCLFDDQDLESESGRVRHEELGRTV